MEEAATHPAPHEGFTLVELSVVLIIIGLIVSAIMVGQSLMFSAQIRQQVKQLQEYTLAYNTFKMKYTEANAK